MKYLQLSGEYATNSERNTFRLPYMCAAIQMEQFEINTQHEKLLFIELFTINADVCISFLATIFLNFFSKNSIIFDLFVCFSSIFFFS